MDRHDQITIAYILHTTPLFIILSHTQNHPSLFVPLSLSLSLSLSLQHALNHLSPPLCLFSLSLSLYQHAKSSLYSLSHSFSLTHTHAHTPPQRQYQLTV